MPLATTLGIRADSYTAEKVVLSMAWAPSLCTAGGVLHGGVIMALADSAGAACAPLNLPDNAAGTTTIESKTNFVGYVKGGRVAATPSIPPPRGGPPRPRAHRPPRFRQAPPQGHPNPPPP